MYGTAIIIINGEWMTRRTNDYYGIYHLLEPHVGHEQAEDAASWCELASCGEEYYINAWIEIRILEEEE